ncbi:DNA integrity scanning protein DisA nucleotide-binding domain protein [Candidatus Woesearchaeota archaeon]|nr:DNA integrity scanning protein DisA nucleotide-binding domain protein [Candidatus Woesearchaeota archaeon]
MAKKEENVYDFLLETGKKLAEKNMGALFVIADSKKFEGTYEILYPQIIRDQRIFEKGCQELILKLAELDGAFLIGEDGSLVAFGARIKQSKVLPGYGTKHAAATGITGNIQDSTAILVSEETRWTKVFKNGEIILEVDTAKAPKKEINKVVSFLTDNDTALLATAGASAAIMGVIPVVIVSGTYLVIKAAAEVVKKNWKK